MRRFTEEQTYLNFAPAANLKVHREYQQTYRKISDLLDANRAILHHVADDFERLSTSQKGRGSDFTVETMFRAVLVHQLEATSLRDTVVRIAESATLREFIRLGEREVMDFTFLGRCVKAIEEDTWKLINETLTGYACTQQWLAPDTIRVDSTVIETNIRYPTDTRLLWDSWRVLTRTLEAIRKERPELVDHRFHHKKVKEDYLYITRFHKSRSKSRQRKVRRSQTRLRDQVQRVHQVSVAVIDRLKPGCPLELLGLVGELKHYVPLVKQVHQVAVRRELKGETVPAKDRIFSLFEEHTELIKRGKAAKPVEFGHAVWLSQSAEKFITDYEVMEEKIPDSELLDDIVYRHKNLYRDYPDAVHADNGFRPTKDVLTEIKQQVKEVHLPVRGRCPAEQRPPAEVYHFRAGIEGSISVLKRAFRMVRCFYRGFKSFASALGMAVCAHNLRLMAHRLAVE